MRVHFIAVGGAVMHNLAIALHLKGYKVTGSDDEIFEPSRSRLKKYGLLPEEDGWFPSRITADIDTVVLGMHARPDNPELKRATEMGLRVVSFPDYLYEQTQNKKRIVVAGSHGKTTTTAIIMHVLKYAGRRFDYMVGSAVEGFETMVGLSDDSDIAVFEGDEYLTSPVDRRPKFLLYKPDIAIINGIAWDHMNVFPTFEQYVEQFRKFIGTIAEDGVLFYYEGDSITKNLVEEFSGGIRKKGYGIHGYFSNKTGFYAASLSRTVKMNIFGEHNMQNLSAAKEACLAAGIDEDTFYDAIGSFTGTAKRLQKLSESSNGVVYLDFAHAPSKVKATLDAVAENHPGHEIVACLELHTFSSLNPGFLPNYSGTLDKASRAYVYFNPHAVEMKKLPPLKKETVLTAFGNKSLSVCESGEELMTELFRIKNRKSIFLLMSSGDFGGINLQVLASALV